MSISDSNDPVFCKSTRSLLSHLAIYNIGVPLSIVFAGCSLVLVSEGFEKEYLISNFGQEVVGRLWFITIVMCVILNIEAFKDYHVRLVVGNGRIVRDGWRRRDRIVVSNVAKLVATTCSPGKVARIKLVLQDGKKIDLRDFANMDSILESIRRIGPDVSQEKMLSKSRFVLILPTAASLLLPFIVFVVLFIVAS